MIELFIYVNALLLASLFCIEVAMKKKRKRIYLFVGKSAKCKVTWINPK